MDTEETTQSENLSSSGAEAPLAAVDVGAVRSAAVAEPLVGSSVSSVEDLEDLLGALEEARAGVDLAQSDLSMVDWRVEDVRRELRDECEASAELRVAAVDAGWVVRKAVEAVEDLVAVLDARIAARREQLKGGGDSSLLPGDGLFGPSSPEVNEEGGVR